MDSLFHWYAAHALEIYTTAVCLATAIWMLLSHARNGGTEIDLEMMVELTIPSATCLDRSRLINLVCRTTAFQFPPFRPERPQLPARRYADAPSTSFYPRSLPMRSRAGSPHGIRRHWILENVGVRKVYRRGFFYQLEFPGKGSNSLKYPEGSLTRRYRWTWRS